MKEQRLKSRNVCRIYRAKMRNVYKKNINGAIVSPVNLLRNLSLMRKINGGKKVLLAVWAINPTLQLYVCVYEREMQTSESLYT